MPGTAAIVTVGSELVEGLRLDTNTAEIARALAPRGWHVTEAVSVPDESAEVSSAIRRLMSAHGLVVVTGGLGPTHDDVTREAASDALGVPLLKDDRLVEMLRPVAERHGRDATAPIYNQASVLEGAEVIDPTTGTAPGLVLEHDGSTIALLPGPPTEMAPMLDTLVSRWRLVRAQPRELGIVGMTETDAQVAASRALESYDGVGFTILASPGDVRILLLDDGVGRDGLDSAARSVAEALGDGCYSQDGSTLAATVVREAIERQLTLCAAESCTGGMVASALSSKSGSSAAFLGGVVSYHNDVKSGLLGVSEQSLAEYGAVSEQVAREMAEGVRERLGADLAVSVTGIAGPGGGTAEKPVGLVWFGLATKHGTTALEKRYPPATREAVRMRATATALDLLRREMLSA